MAGLFTRAAIVGSLTAGLCAGWVTVLLARQAPVAGEAQARLAVGDYDGAETLARRGAEQDRLRFGAGSVEEADALDLLVRTLILNGRVSQTDTREVAEHALRVRLVRNGGGDAGAAAALAHLSDVAAAAADFSAAIAFADRGVVAAGNAERPEGLGVAHALDRMGAALGLAERFDRALGVLERSLRLKESVGAAPNDVAGTLEELAFVLHSKGEYARAGDVLRRALDLRGELGLEHPDGIRALNLLAEQEWFDGNLLVSRAASERAVALARRSLRADHPALAFSLRSLGATLSDLGELDRALALKEQALAMAERAHGAGHHTTAAYLHSLGLSELDRGDYQVARTHFGRALAIYAARYGGRHQLVATAHSVLALAEARLGDYRSAVRHQATAVRIHSDVGGPTHPFVAVTLTALASIRLEQGLPDEARRLLERALSIREARFGTTHRDVALTLADLAVALARSGLRQRAEVLASRAVAIWDNLGTPDAPEFATVLTIAADLRAARAHWAGAETYYDRAMAIRARTFGVSHPLYGESVAGMATTLLAMGDSQRALDAATTAEEIGRDHLRLMVRSLPERQALNYAATRPRGLDVLLQLAEASPDAAEVAFDALVRGRALVLDEMASRLRGARATGDGTSILDSYVAAQQRLANLLVRGRGGQAPHEYDALVDDTRGDVETAEQALAHVSREFQRRQTRAAVGLTDVRDVLPDDTALVSYVRYRRRLLRDNGAASRPAATGGAAALDSYAALVLRGDKPVVVVPLGSAARIERLAAAWRADIASPGSATDQTRLSGAALRRVIWDPAAAYVTGLRQVLVVPDGVLSLVPLAALPTSRHRYLVDTGPVVHYLSAERDVVAPAADRPPRAGLLALGSPSFDARPAGVPLAAGTPARRGGAEPCLDLASTVFAPLTGTLREVNEVSALWRASMLDGTPEVRVGARASERAFKERAPFFSVLHLATHGFFAGHACGPPVRSTRGVGGLATPGRTVPDRPLSLSGLALAGANRRAQRRPDEDDGILTAEEVATLELDGVEWAVLSACDTGVGGIEAGEGVFGLRRAFQIAGARTVIMSLWSVDDRATVRWMQALYDARFRQHRTTAQAAHDASTAVLQERRARGQSTHPFYWAPFVAAGEWR